MESSPLDYPMQRARGRVNQSIIVDTGKHAAAMAICAALCGLCAAVSWWAAVTHRDDYLYTQDEYQKVRNHTIELEARLKSLTEEVQEMKRHE